MIALLAGLLAAQTAPPAAGAAAPGQAETQEAGPQQEAGPETQVAPPEAREPVTGFLDFGFRWVPRLDGNEDMYRTFVNYGEGPKLFGANLSLENLKPAWFDRFHVQANSWGGEPYSTVRVNADRAGSYEFSFSHRRLDYFSNVADFANPLLGFGVLDSQQARDFQRRMWDAELTLWPHHRISPFVQFSRTARSGPGFNPFVGSGNEFVSNVRFDDSTNLFRGGTHVNFSRIRFTVEAGGAEFDDSERLFFGGPRSFGNRLTGTRAPSPVLGRTTFLDAAEQRYRVEGNSFFARASVFAQPFSVLDVSGQFAFSQASRDFRFEETATGSFAVTPQLIGFSQAASQAFGEALRPRPSGNVSLEVRPFSRLRIIDSFYTNRFHQSSSRLFTQVLSGVVGLAGTTAPPTRQIEEPGFGLYTTDYNRHQVEAIVAVHPRVSLRGGHRLEWWDVKLPAPVLAGGVQFEEGEQRRSIALGGFTVRLLRDLHLTGDTEISSGDTALYRISLLEYQKVKLGLRYRPRPSLSVFAKFTYLGNDNDQSTIELEARSRDLAVGAFFAPNDGRRVTVALDYSHSDIDSDIFYLAPSTRDRERFVYDLEAHQASAFVNVAIVRGARISLGGAVVVADGNRASEFWQPQAELSIPLHRRVNWLNQWRYYGYRSDNYLFENFNSHLFSTGLRVTVGE